METHEDKRREDETVRALVKAAATCGDVEQAVAPVGEPRSNDDEEDEAARIARDHGFGPDRLIAMRSLARSRGVSLEVVLRAALRGDLREIVALPPIPAAERREDHI